MTADKKVLCMNPDPSKQPCRIDAWKYDTVRSAILKSLGAKPKGVPFRELPGAVRSRLSSSALKRLGSVTWYTVTVKLDLEARGAVERVSVSGSQVIRRVKGRKSSRS